MKDSGVVEAVSLSGSHDFHKKLQEKIILAPGLGVSGDAHAGRTVKHRSRVAQDASQPNLRQVHLIHAELLDELHGMGFQVGPGQMGENITLRGISLLRLPAGTKLHFGQCAVVQLTGLRNPCAQLDQFQPGLMHAVLERDAEGRLIGKAGVFGVVLQGGEVRPGDRVVVELPPEPHRPMEKV